MAKPTSQKKYRKTLALIFLIYSVAFGGTVFLILGISDSFGHKIFPSAFGASLGGIFFGAAMTWVTAGMWRRSGGLDTAKRMQGAIRKRQLPLGIDLSEWNQLLVKREADALRGRWLYPIFFGIFACLYLLLGATNVFPDLGPLPWIGAALFGGFAIYSPFDTERRLRGIRALKSELATQRPPDSEDLI